MFLFYYDQTGSGPVIPKTTKPYAELSVMDMGSYTKLAKIQLLLYEINSFEINSPVTSLSNVKGFAFILMPVIAQT